jgi:hypothetical protein
MPIWILDDGPLDTLARVVEPTAVMSWPDGMLAIADATRRKATGRRLELLGTSPSPFFVFSVSMDGAGARILYEHLRQPSTSDKNLAEHEALAWALSDCEDAILVTADKRAAFPALAELGRARAAHPSELWIEFVEAGLVSRLQFAELCRLTSQGEQLPVPLRCRDLANRSN